MQPFTPNEPIEGEPILPWAQEMTRAVRALTPTSTPDIRAQVTPSGTSYQLARFARATKQETSPDSDIDSTDFAESIATRTVEGDSALEIAGFFVGTPEDKSLADLLDISEANAKSNYKILVRKHEVGSRPETGFVPIGDLTDGTDLIDTGERDPGGDTCGEGGYPGIDPGDGTDGYPGSDTEPPVYPGDGRGDTGDYPGKGNDCW
jgi:hypothetical protein